MTEDVELWMEFIKRDIPRWEEYELPEQPECWYDVYCELRQIVQKAVDEDAERLKMALDGINSERAKHSAILVTDRRGIRLPRERPTVKQRYASYDRKVGGVRPVFIPPGRGSSGSADPHAASGWSLERPSIPRTDSSKKKNSIFAATKRNRILAVPTKQLNNRATQVIRAPRSLIEEHRRPSVPVQTRRSPEAPDLIAPGRTKIYNTFGGSGAHLTPTDPSLQEREARLRALTSGKPVPQKPPAVFAEGSVEGTRPGMGPKAHSDGNVASRVSVPASSPRTISPDRRPPDDHLGTTSDASPDLDLHQFTQSSPERTQPTRPVIVRKRPAPSVFIQPRKKKIS